MRNIKNKLIVLISFLVLYSCETDLDINRDPDLLSPDQIPMSLELPSAETGIAGSAGAYLAIVGGFWSQYWTQSAIANQYKQIDDYSLNSNDNLINGNWNSMYDALTDIRNIKKNAEQSSNWNYYLIATTLEVYSSQILVDLYGSIPYTEANNSSILNPKFESADVVYDKMVSDLKLALSKDFGSSPIDNVPGTTDFIFAGNMNKWKEFANTLLLKLYLRQSEVRPTIAQQGILELYANNTVFLQQSAAITQFVDEAGRSNPLYESDRRQLNVATNLRASKTLGSFLQDNSDTRLGLFYSGTTFQNQGDYTNPSGANVSIVKLAATDPFYFISLAESKFLQAEASVRYLGGANAQNLYNQGVTSAFNQWGLDASTFLSGVYAYPNGTQSENIEAIITQKWVSFFPGRGYESFIEQNRTGFPLVSNVPQTSGSYVSGQFAYSVQGLTGGLFPKRLEYPNQELQRNSNAPTTVISITEKVWYEVN